MILRSGIFKKIVTIKIDKLEYIEVKNVCSSKASLREWKGKLGSGKRYYAM